MLATDSQTTTLAGLSTTWLDDGLTLLSVESSPARRMCWLAQDNVLLATRHSLLDKKTLSSFPINIAAPPKKRPGIIIETEVECSTAKKTWPLKTWSVMISRTAVPDPRDYTKPKLSSLRTLNTIFHSHVAGPPKNLTCTVFQEWYQNWYLLNNTTSWIARTAHKQSLKVCLKHGLMVV